MIYSMKLNDGTILNSPEEIHQGATKYFQDILTKPNNADHVTLSHLLESVVINEENSFLCQDPDIEEVIDIVYSIPKHSALG